MAEQEKALERLNVQLDADTRNKLNNLAKVTGWSVALIIRKCIGEGLPVVEQKAFADPDIKQRIEQEKRRWSEAARTLSRLEQSKEKE